jgi:dihydroorotate dehydrogenase (fumarate)
MPRDWGMGELAGNLQNYSEKKRSMVMANLKTSYMGLTLESPIVVGACSLSKEIDTIKQIEAAGAGALVLKSLFEEQIQLEQAEFETQLGQHDALYAESVSLFPKLEHGGHKEHIFWVEKAKKAVSIPLIASLNAVNESTWLEYAKALAKTGVDGLELNFYSPPLNPETRALEIELRELETFAKIREAVDIPIAVKLHPYYTNLFNVGTEFSKLGADALVLFNRLFQPDIDIEKRTEKQGLSLSRSADSFLSLRWIGLLHQRVQSDLIGGTGVLNSEDVIKMILAGANAVQVVSTLYENELSVIGEITQGLTQWMDKNEYGSLDDFRGTVSKQNVKDPWGFERAHYIKALLGFD